MERKGAGRECEGKAVGRKREEGEGEGKEVGRGRGRKMGGRRWREGGGRCERAGEAKRLRKRRGMREKGDTGKEKD